jgi:peptide/nickel transport system substrate-binding protein
VDPRIDALIDEAATEVNPQRRRALYADFVRAVQTELPLWMPIEQIFVSVFNRRVRNGGNNPRWASSSWHDTWLAS